MAQERNEINVSPKNNSSISEAQRKEFRAKAAKVVTRGFVVDRLNVETPEDVHGEWIRDEPVALAGARALGFELDTKYAVNSALHTDATGKAKVGDVVFMTMPKWQKEEIDKLKQEHYNRQHGVKGNKPVEETEYASKLDKSMPVINESKTTNASLSTLTTD